MNYQKIQQRTQEWWELKVGKVSGTKFGQLISGRSNNLIETLANEILDGHVEIDDYISEEMQFGLDNEELAIDLYESISGITFERGGVILSDFCENHLASPDGLNVNDGIVLEVKCTMNGVIHLGRFSSGIDSRYMPQVINYFAVSNDIKEVHWISYCPFRPEREIVSIIFTRDFILDEKKNITIQKQVEIGRSLLEKTKLSVNKLINDFKTIKF